MEATVAHSLETMNKGSLASRLADPRTESTIGATQRESRSPDVASCMSLIFADCSAGWCSSSTSSLLAAPVPARLS